LRIGLLVAAGLVVASVTACSGLSVSDDGTVTLQEGDETVSVLQNTTTDSATLDGSATTVKVDSRAGFVRLRSGGAPGKIGVERELHYRGSKPDGTWHRLTGQTLDLNGSCGTSCIVSYTITLPGRPAVTGKMGAGEFDANQTGPIDLTMSAGRIAVADAAGPVKATTTVGEVDITMTAPADASVKTQAGSISLSVPGTDYAVTTKTTVGVRHGSLPDRSSGAHRIDLTSNVGEVRLDSH